MFPWCETREILRKIKAVLLAVFRQISKKRLVIKPVGKFNSN